MPDQIAHYLYGCEMLRRADLTSRIDASGAAFRAGTFGPDPLFNDIHAAVRRCGLGMHKRPGREPMEILRRALTEKKASEGYAAGFFCHYALDRICHPLLYDMQLKGEAMHVPVETALDRILYQKKMGSLPMKLPLDDDVICTAALLYPVLSPSGFKSDVRLYLMLRRMMSTGGTPLACVNALILPKHRGLVPFSKPDQRTRAGIDRLEQVMRENIDLAAKQLKLFFDAADHDAALDRWIDADFSGR